MRLAKKKRPSDPNELAYQVVRESTSDEPIPEPDPKDPQESGRKGGLKGGPARAKKLSKKRRQEIARKAAEARWRKEAP
jgi:hypothetical protein